MATGASTKLQLTYICTDKERHTFSWACAKEDVEASRVKNLAAGMVEYGEIFKYPPDTLSKAQVVKTTVREIDVKD